MMDDCDDVGGLGDGTQVCCDGGVGEMWTECAVSPGQKRVSWLKELVGKNFKKRKLEI